MEGMVEGACRCHRQSVSRMKTGKPDAIPKGMPTQNKPIEKFLSEFPVVRGKPEFNNNNTHDVLPTSLFSS